MKMYEGKIGLIGAGTWSRTGTGSGFTKHSIVEIGSHTLKNLIISDYLGNFVHTGSQARFGVSGGLGNRLLLLEINGEKYKHGYSQLILAHLLMSVYAALF